MLSHPPNEHNLSFTFCNSIDGKFFIFIWTHYVQLSWNKENLSLGLISSNQTGLEYNGYTIENNDLTTILNLTLSYLYDYILINC